MDFSEGSHKTSSMTKTFKCEKCSKSFRHKNNLKRHTNTHSTDRSSIKTEFQCSECDVSLSSLSGMSLHTKAKHDGIIHACKHCNFTTQYKQSLLNHEGIHKGKQYFCQKCDKYYTDNSSLYRHTKAVHDGVIFSCIHCNYKVSYLTGLKKHQRIHYQQKVVTRKEETKHCCKICGNLFSRCDYLKVHLIRHKEKKAFACSYCNKSFIESGHLEEHMRTHPEKNFVCSKCNKCYSRRDHLQRHDTTHTGVKPF